MRTEKSLCDLCVGNRAFVIRLSATGCLRRRLLDVGLIPGSTVECVGISPLGDPRAYFVRGSQIAIRNKDAKDIIIE